MTIPKAIEKRHTPLLQALQAVTNINLKMVSRTVVALEEMRQFVVRAMEAVGTKGDHAAALADLLVTADYRGHFSHGLNRLG